MVFSPLKAGSRFNLTASFCEHKLSLVYEPVLVAFMILRDLESFF